MPGWGQRAPPNQALLTKTRPGLDPERSGIRGWKRVSLPFEDERPDFGRAVGHSRHPTGYGSRLAGQVSGDELMLISGRRPMSTSVVPCPLCFFWALSCPAPPRSPSSASRPSATRGRPP
jgi:hypothetical protein